MSERDVAGTIGPEHDAFRELLAGLVDEELGPEDRERVERHLEGCPTCRRALQAQVLIRGRLMKETVSATSESLADQVMQRIAALEDPAPPVAPPRRTRLLEWAGWLAAAAVLLTWLVGGALREAAPLDDSSHPRVVTVDSNPIPISSELLGQFQRMDRSDLPLDLDLTQLKNEVPFHVPALRAPHMRFLAAWTTQVFGETAAAIAYRCHDRLVIQYVVSERQFFRFPELRQAIAEQGIYAASRGELSTVAWADRESGSFLVGEFTPSELVAMRL